MNDILLGILFYVLRLLGCVFLVRTGAEIRKKYMLTWDPRATAIRIFISITIAMLAISARDIHNQILWIWGL